ncbi:MAG: GNAT family N-acetyltransferase, partial [bacterium]|nr:GNAT family N-acetyltransferase [bacterium]
MSAYDAGEVLTLQRAAYATEAQIYGDPFLPALTQTLDELRVEIASCTGFVVLQGDRIVAAVRASRHGSHVHIGRLTVAPDMQGSGLGSMLLGEVEASTDAEYAELFTGHLSAANIRLYERFGYVESHRKTLKSGVELVYLRKS